MTHRAAPGRKQVLTLVYNDIRRDARVRRISDALTDRYDVTLISIAPRDAGPLPDIGFRVLELPIDHLGRFARSKHVLFWLQAFRAGLSLSFDAVHCHDVYPIPVAAVLARLRGVPLVYDAHELVDHRRPEPTLAGRFWDAAHRWAIRRSELVITANESRSRFLVERGYEPRRPPVAVMNISDGRLPVSPSAGQAAVRQAGAPAGSRLVIYQGWVARQRRTVELVEAFARLPEDLHLLVVGDGPAMREVQRRIDDLGLRPRVHVTGYLPKSRVIELVAASEVGIVLYDDAVLNNYYCAPNKLFDYLGAEIPVVASDLPEPRRVLEGTGAGVLLREGSVDALAQAILQASRLHPAPSVFGQIRKRFNWSDQVDRLMDAYDRDIFPDDPVL